MIIELNKTGFATQAKKLKEFLAAKGVDVPLTEAQNFLSTEVYNQPNTNTLMAILRPEAEAGEIYQVSWIYSGDCEGSNTFQTNGRMTDDQAKALHDVLVAFGIATYKIEDIFVERVIRPGEALNANFAELLKEIDGAIGLSDGDYHNPDIIDYLTGRRAARTFNVHAVSPEFTLNDTTGARARGRGRKAKVDRYDLRIGEASEDVAPFTMIRYITCEDIAHAPAPVETDYVLYKTLMMTVVAENADEAIHLAREILVAEGHLTND